MKWDKINIFTKDIENVCNALYMLDVYEFEIVDGFDEIKKELDKRAKYWDFIDEEKMKALLGDERVVVYVPEDNKELIDIVCNGLKNCSAVNRITVDSMADEDWINSWRQFFKPITVGDKLVVLPCWEQEEPKGKLVIRIDPGMIFGTGSHETTRLCLGELERLIKGGEQVLDLGCGSGILAIGALLLGADGAFCVDIEENAKKSVEENAEYSNINKPLEVVIGDLLEDEKLIARIEKQEFDIIVANIVAGVIIELLSLVKNALKSDGIFICSGIIDDKKESVKNALQSAGFKIINEKSEDKWTAFTAVL